MENLKMILHLLYKKVPIQEVIEGKIRSDFFDEAELLRLMTSYVLHYSENEASNLLSYYTYIFQQQAEREGRSASEKLDVFEALFYSACRFLHVKNNEICCRYDRLIEWRQATVEMGEDLFVAAYLAAAVPVSEVKKRGFGWKRVVGHDNVQLNTVVNRGYSENHFHLYGSAPIFHISWISLMNNISSAKFIDALTSYDENRRNVNVAYTSKYRELPFYTRALQAALIRLAIYSMLSGKHMKIGNYSVSTRNIAGFFDKSMIGKEEWIIYSDTLACLRECRKLNFEDPSVQFSFSYIIETICIVVSTLQQDSSCWRETEALRKILRKRFDKYKITIAQLREVLIMEEDVNFPDLFLKILKNVPQIELEDARFFITDLESFYEFWDQITLKNITMYLKNPEELMFQIHFLQSEIDAFRLSGNTQPNQERFLDYALQDLDTQKEDRHQIKFLFSGERWLMYCMLRKIYKEEKFAAEYKNLFYAYLLIKEGIRSELIQTNRNVGFRNFQKYQARKGDLLADDIYKNIFVKLAVSQELITDKLNRLEVRISPSATVESNRKMILRTDELLDPDQTMKQKFFYTLHFTKSPDRTETYDGICRCRHWRKRRQVKNQALAIAGLREKYPLVGRRVLGIDAASNEIGCRPEVFAPVYRYLKNHRYSYNTAEGERNLPQLRLTYHVGEDFLDFVDGLRAMDEAIHFLGIGSGDRLGHAIVLGQDVNDWYASKNFRIILPRQDYLDNLVWMYHKIIEWNIEGLHNFKEWLLEEFTILFSEIYASSVSEKELECIVGRVKRAGRDGKYLAMNFEVSIFHYYYAWMLRGDSPEFYENGFYDEEYFKHKHSSFSINESFPEYYDIRRRPEITLLYYMYHYNPKVRAEGDRVQEFFVSKQYVKAVSELQKVLRKEIADCGIAIETNPSSNVLIGTFRQYEKHPMLQFFNKGLTRDSDVIEACPQISISVNTDDQGVFSTSLENEYALIACALESVSDVMGNPLYKKSDIYEWLDNIREMGNEQSFGYIADMKERGLYYD